MKHLTYSKRFLIAVFLILLISFTFHFSRFRVLAATDSFNVNLTVDTEAAAEEEEEEEPGGGGELPDTAAPTIYAIKVIDLTQTSASITWKTTEPAFSTLYLGTTIDYEKVVLVGTELSAEHSAVLDELDIETIYNFKITAEDNRKNKGETDNKTFSTLPLPDTIPPANVRNFEAIPGDKKVTLLWDDPLDEDFKGVLIKKAVDFYPSQPWEGETVYFGSGQSTVDDDVENGITYYYTAFSYDMAENHSSGAVAQATPQAPPVIPPIGPPPPPPPQPPPVLPPVEPPPPEVDEITIEDFKFIQEDEILPISKDGEIELKTMDLLTTIDYEDVPEVLKTIMITLEKENKYFSFLLRVDEEKTSYQATLAPLDPGAYPMTLYVLDYKNQALKTIKGMLEVKGTAKLPGLPPFEELRWQAVWDFWWLLLVLLILIIICLLTLYYLKEKRKKQAEEEQDYQNIG